MWKVILATIVIFGTGVVTGGLLVSHSLGSPARPALNQPRPAQALSPGGVRTDFLRRAGRELDLTPEQREQVDQILKASQERSRQIMEPVAPAIRKELQRTKDKFREVLTPEQKAKFDGLLKRQHQREAPRTGAPDRSSPFSPANAP